MKTTLPGRPCASCHWRKAPIRAFTLIEILIAMGIFSLVLAAIFSTWTAILRASKVGNDAAASVQRARIAIATLEQSLGSAQSFVVHQATHPEYYSFINDGGSEPSFSFVARLAKSFPRSGRFGDLDVRRVTFSVEQGPDYNSGKQLVLRQTPLAMNMDVDEKEHPLVLAKNVRDFQVSFWDTKLNDWVDEWTTTNQLPVVVRVSLKIGLHGQSAQAVDQITRIVSLPSVGVQAGWQVPRMAGMPGGPGTPGVPQPGMPGQPGALPGQPGMPGRTGFQQPGQFNPGQPVQPR